ncbi:tetratricopeptide repeat protein [Veronia pacifica]|uniref:Sel1 repeat family protein n=1 Tax=Veronia pacifica TaxID=1080227 RepID=A0A1C3EID6_9GAMM|nr:SEL1-like repeat protein [Veronia pacifica]ODA32990.1 hypothetical protein A8L45_11885 [Veronia pacifica]
MLRFVLILLPTILITLNGCTENSTTDQTLTHFSLPSDATSSASCPTVSSYPLPFLTSQFFEGWKVLRSHTLHNETCKHATPYFTRGLEDPSVFRLSSLYLEYCSSIGGSINAEDSPVKHSPISLEYDELKWIVELASCDSQVEQYALGRLFLQGHLVPKNTEKALFYLTMAAQKEHPTAQIQLIETLKDIGENQVAELWLERARKNGFIDDTARLSRTAAHQTP